MLSPFLWEALLHSCTSGSMSGLHVLLCFQTIGALKGRISELQWSAMNQEMQVKSLESEKQELKEQLDLEHRCVRWSQQGPPSWHVLSAPLPGCPDCSGLGSPRRAGVCAELQDHS